MVLLFEGTTSHEMSFEDTYSLVSFAIQSTSPSTKLGDVQLLLLPNPVCILTISFTVFMKVSNWKTTKVTPFLDSHDILYPQILYKIIIQLCLNELMIASNDHDFTIPK